MNDQNSLRNVAVLIVLALVYIVPALFIPSQAMLDIVSVPMLVFGAYAIYLVIGEAFNDFWSGRQDRAALGLFALTAILISVVITRPYGIITRNVEGASAILEPTHIYPIALYIQAIGLMLFSRASTPSAVAHKHTGIGQLVAGIVIGALVASSKVLEPILAGIGKIAGKLF